MNRFVLPVVGTATVVLLLILGLGDFDGEDLPLTKSSVAPIGSGSAEEASAHTAAAAVPERLLHPDVSDSSVRLLQRRTGSHPLFANEHELIEARSNEVLFSTSVTPNAASKSPLADTRRLSDGRRWIKYNLMVLGSRVEGDQFLLPTGSSDVQQAEIDSVEVLPGLYRWSGRILDGLGSTFSITQSFDEQYAIGTISTAHGEYQIQSKNGIGWIAESSKEFFLPPGGDDTVEDPHHQEEPVRQ